MHVVNIEDVNLKKRKAELLETLEEIKKMVENNEITEFVATSINDDGDVRIHAYCKDFVGGVGMFEIGKQIFISQEA